MLDNFWRRLQYFRKAAVDSATASELYADGKEALRKEFLGKPGAHVAAEMAQAAANLSAALDKFDEGILRIGEMLVVKSTACGKKRLLMETITPEIARELDANPHLATDPKALIEFFERRASTRAVESEGEPVVEVKPQGVAESEAQARKLIDGEEPTDRPAEPVVD